MATPSASADRNLLFGILAVQMDFISRDALIAAMNAWVLEKSKALGQILVEQGTLPARARDKLEAVVELHLEIHGGDPRKSLAAVSSIGSAREELQNVVDAELQASLAQLSAARQEEDPGATRPLAEAEASGPGIRFRILHKHAEGGLGAIFVAQDEELHRHVALKEIKEKFADHADSRSRFLREAEVTGGLEHPGIVPVYGLGFYPDGRPFYAMRFIKGDSLRDAIQHFHTADRLRRDPGERSLAFRELLQRFVDACNALAYAHARGILHRDIKPHNIMLGKYGETLVVDWGLAKVIGRPDTATLDFEEGTLQPFSSSDTASTQTGDIIGTPTYMSPEQAGGQLDQLGPASDIYSLGATLYELLTGVAPVQGNFAGEMLAKVRRGDWLPPRKVRTDIPAALEAVCLKAMALRPEDRYATALGLAADIEHWLADEPVSAYREPLPMRLRRWMRRHRGLVTGLALAAVVALVGLASGLMIVASLNRQLDLTNTALIEKSTQLDLRNAELAAINVKERQARERAEQALDKLTSMSGRAMDYQSSGQMDKAIPLWQETLELSESVLGAWHPNTISLMEMLATAHQTAGRPAQALPLAQEALKRKKKLLGANHPDVRMRMNSLALAYQTVGRQAEAVQLYEEGLNVSRATNGPTHPETLNSMNLLARAYQRAGRLADAVPLYEEVLRLHAQTP
jgi:serine/threonine-protein kinase